MSILRCATCGGPVRLIVEPSTLCQFAWHAYYCDTCEGETTAQLIVTGPVKLPTTTEATTR